MKSFSLHPLKTFFVIADDTHTGGICAGDDHSGCGESEY
jgi:hypothetical protein